jgi:hypothetical protein
VNGFPTVTVLLRKAALPPLEAPPEIGASPLAVPVLLGMALGGGEASYGGTNWLQAAAVAAAVVGVLAAAARRRRESCAPGAGVDRAVAVVLALALVTDVAAAHGAVRHLLPAALIAFAFFGALPAALFANSPRLQLGAAGVLGTLVLVPNLWFLPQAAGAFGSRPPFGADVRAVVDGLTTRGLTRGYSDYWTAYPVTYVSGERIVVSPLAATVWGGRFDRVPAYGPEVDASWTTSGRFLLLDAQCSPEPYVGPLAAAGATYQLDTLFNQILLWDVRARPGVQYETLRRWRDAIASRKVC